MKDQNNHLPFIVPFIGKIIERIYQIKLPIIGHLPLQRQIRILFVCLFISLLFGGLFGWISSADEKLQSIQAHIAGDALMHTQRVGKAAPNAIQGNPDAFKQLQESRYDLIIDLNLLVKGGDYKTYSLDSAKSINVALLSDSEKIWSSTDKAAGTILKLQKELIIFADALKKLTTTTPLLFKLSEEIADKKVQNGGSSREISAIDQLQLLSLRLEYGVSSLISAESVNPETVLLLKKELTTYNDLLDGMLNGSDAMATQDTETKNKLTELKTTFAHYQQSVLTLLSNSQSYIDAKKAGQLLASDNEDLRLHLLAVQTNYRNQSELTTLSDYFMFLGLAMTFLAASGMALVLLQDGYSHVQKESARRVDADMQMMQAQKQESEAKQVNDQNQAAILRLMSELQEIADGDLTIRATVSNDITGAIADTVNFAVEELCNLVGRVAILTAQVTTSANQAEEVSSMLLNASQQQLNEINTASKEILTLAADIAGLAGHIQHIVSATEKMQDGVQQTAQLIRVSSVLAQELENSVSRFRLRV
jgi:twitching motility protein PilJ